MKKVLIAAAVATAFFAQGAKAQTNLQTFWDFGRGHVTTTLEGYYGDNWGDTFFFVDYDYNTKNPDGKFIGVSGSYFEIARGLNFWKNTSLADLSAHVEYNGGVGFGSQNFLFGADYLLHNADYSNTFKFTLMYKTFSGNASSDTPLQFTFVWGMKNLFGVDGLNFSGFADIWGENTKYWYADPVDDQAEEGNSSSSQSLSSGTMWASTSAWTTSTSAPKSSSATTSPATTASTAVLASAPSGYSNSAARCLHSYVNCSASTRRPTACVPR